MHPNHKNLLKVNNFYLLNHLEISNDPNPISILNALGILKENHVADINSQSSNIKKVDKFLSILPKRGSKAFDKFMEALVQSQQEYIVDKLNMCSGVPVSEVPVPFVDTTDNLIDNRSLNKTNRLMLLMNNYNFGNDEHNRKGSEKDVEQLKSFFTEIGYKLFDDKSYEDLTSTEMNEIIKEFSLYIAKNSINSAVIIIMSHGKNKRISGIDGHFVDLQHVYKILSCGTEQIFKLIIFSCCRGETAALASMLVMESISHSDSLSINDEIQKDRYDEFAWQVGNYIPKNAVVLYSTQENYQSHRETTGTVFIQALLSIFKTHYKTKPLREMVMMIRSEMKRLYPKYDQWPDIKENYFANFYL
uniref:Caspase 2 n=1 Tax=Schmidtea mediterranea TaxID=79327 RepID=H2DL21_SCHMD|nr:caspase 2 [Schmidtea mediterranea]